MLHTKLINERSVKWYEAAIPHPSAFHCKNYWYIGLIDIPKEQRGKGLAGKLITRFCRRKKKPIYVALHKYKNIDMNGWILKPLFKRLGFKVLSKGEFVIEMART